MLLAMGLGSGYLMVTSTINTVLLARTEPEMRGRVTSFYILMLVGIFPIGGQVMGVVADVRSAPFALMIGGIACLSLASVLTLIPGLIREAMSVVEG